MPEVRLIDVDALKYALCACLCGSYEQCQEWCHTLAVISVQPIIDAQPVRHGRWDDSADGITPICTVCGRTHRCFNRTPNFCPNCGARMDGGSDNDGS